MRVSRISLIIKTVSSSSEDASTANKKEGKQLVLHAVYTASPHVTAIAHTVRYRTNMDYVLSLQWNLSVKDTLN